MRVLFANGTGYLPQRVGGAQSSTDQLASRLRARGHDVAVLCRIDAGGWTEFSSRVKRRLSGRNFARGTFNGYPVWRAWDPTNTIEVVRQFKPDVALVQNGSTVLLAQDLERQDVPVVLYFRNVEFDELAGDPAMLKEAFYISNSEFTAQKHRERFGVESTVIPPLVDGDRYRTATTRESVLLVNPVVQKGLEVAIAVAERCPDIPFTFVESWNLPKEHAVLVKRVAKIPNVTLRPRTSDMKSIYARAKVLLAPSKWEEAWGRIVTEAQVSGIPVVASRRGGLPEAVGPGGVLLDYEAPIEDWVAAVRRLWNDEAHYASLSAAALAWSDRPQLKLDHQLGQLVEVLKQAVGSRAQGRQATHLSRPDRQVHGA